MKEVTRVMLYFDGSVNNPRTTITSSSSVYEDTELPDKEHVWKP